MNKYSVAFFVVFAICIAFLSGCGTKEAALPPDGVYWVEVKSDSSMFRIVDCRLTVEDGSMSAVIKLSGQGFGELYLGTAEQAAADSNERHIPYQDTPDEKHSYEIPVSALDTDIELAGKSIRKETWYGHTVVFKSETLKPYEEQASHGLPDGEYTVHVMLSGGSGKTTVESPAKLTVKGGVLTAAVTWSSPHYTYMIVNGEKYFPVSTEGGSTFEIPVTFDEDIPITAQTVAMSEPHDIEYLLRFERASVILALVYAQNFTVSYAEDTPLIQFSDGTAFTVKKHPQKIYLAATSAMCLFDALDGLDRLNYSGTNAEDWYIENARAAMERGELIYAGKYSAPDYELLLSDGCDLAIESNMISHAPEVKEKLESLGIPVIVDRSSYETHPLGRTEWIKLYGVLLGKEALAAEIFQEQMNALLAVSGEEPTDKTIAFFYINSAGLPVVRKSGDYVAEMIELAGGRYVFDDIGDPDTATGTVTLEMEAFYNAVKKADIIIYNSTIGNEVETLDDLLARSGLLKDFQAVQSGNVWCVSNNFYQETTGFGFMIADMRQVFENGQVDGLRYLRKLW